MNDYVHKKHSSIIPTYCFKENWDEGRKLGLDHFWNCTETVPDINAFHAADNAELFDIKLSSYLNADEYYTVIDRIKEISKSRTQPVFVHFSNEACETLSNHAISLFWELSERVYVSDKICFEFMHKVVTCGEPFEPNVEFFEKIISTYPDMDWLKLSILDKDEITEWIYYHKNMDLIHRK